MNFRQLAILIVVTLVLIYAASNYLDKRTPVKTLDKALLFPTLSEQINQVKIVEIKG